MRIVFLAHRVPFPPDKGDKIRSFHELRALAERGHKVHLGSFIDCDEDMGHSAALHRFCRSVDLVRLTRGRASTRALAALPGRRSLSVAFYRSQAMRRAVRRRLADGVDAFVVYSSTMAQYVPDSWADRTIVDLVDADSAKWSHYAQLMRPPLSWLYRTEGARLRAYEQAIVNRYAHVIVSTGPEAELIVGDRGAPPTNLHVITNGVDLNRFSPTKAAADAVSHRAIPPGVEPLVFTGLMDYYPNVDAAVFFGREVLPVVRAAVPDAVFFIIGRNPSRSVRRLTSQEGVVVTGPVSDIRPYLGAASVYVAPLRIARGVQNKVLEAMACGCAVVATPATVEGLRVVNGEHMLVAATAADLADAVVMLLRHPERRRQLSMSARRFVERVHRWEPPMRAFTDLVESVGVGCSAKDISSTPAAGDIRDWEPVTRV